MFHSLTIRLYVHLPPKFVSTPLLGIHDHLNRYLLKYHPQLNGVVMSYSDINIHTNLARIINESPFIHFYITCTFLLFKPVVGMSLKGVINLQSPGHIGLVIFNLFNVSISRTEILQYGFQFVPSTPADQVDVQHHLSIVNGNWVHIASNTHLSIGSDLEFVVLEITPSRHLIEIKGSLKDVTFPDILPPACNSNMNFNTSICQNPIQGTLTTFSDNEDSMEQKPAAVSSEPKLKSKKSRKMNQDKTKTDSENIFPPPTSTTIQSDLQESKPRKKSQKTKRSKDANNSNCKHSKDRNNSKCNQDQVMSLPNPAHVDPKLMLEPVDNLVKSEGMEPKPLKRIRKRSRRSLEQNGTQGTSSASLPEPDILLKKPKLESAENFKKKSRVD